MTKEALELMRQRVNQGEVPSRDELTEALATLRVSRAAAPAIKTPKVPKAKLTKNSPELLALLEDLK
jgi:hypothetical protein